MSQLIRKAGPDQGSVYVIPEMNSYSSGWMQSAEGFVAPKLFPSIGTASQAGKYKVFPRGHFFRDGMAKRADGARSAGGGFEVSENSFYCNVWALHTRQGPQVRANARMVDLDQAATRFLSMQAMLSMEIQWTSTYFANSVWTTNLEGVSSNPSTNQFLSFASSSALPMTTLRDAIRSQQSLTGFRPNKAVFDQQTWDVFREHPNVINRVNAGQTSGFATVTRQQVAQALELDEILVSSAVKATTAEDTSPTSDSYSFVAGNGILLAYVNPTPNVFEPTAGLSFHWTGYLNGAAGEFGQVMTSWYDQPTRAQFYEIEQARDIHLVSADMGTFLRTPLA